jgi:hypothetical protein
MATTDAYRIRHNQIARYNSHLINLLSVYIILNTPFILFAMINLLPLK